ncbi:MAG: 3-deoxy-8-phosphooctulonate synthase [Nitrospinaceae bacterium]|mgnify:FL=1|jgi:2-dehydro-3-deoxyphosphooctonate aldolase (KDO 8-P synthase)|nr:3-deoxy-8-phosphooctulonate synthase [Nitrospina sp.]MDG1842768.1 3-deoxy-8-phosphooctulonate synthase [Nitrospinaceae bacterium]MBT4260430.1 3-deoxy-8-phosphooctulonate synthase [Nitrospina sp.]MBT5257397.1 3-deoxy-8-phosphooctulonate synthase [Nitrospina sp.]MBT6296786.1 3-deoxy-8-phosphooctulonate synthase [Nitrospina sp.]|tara:strand:+ start:3869 stop:4708 length:840 start_codon:yes stop_codon:yes gene_type:complete
MGLKVKKTKLVTVGKVKIGGGKPIVLIAGPCVIESQSHVLNTAEKIKRAASDADIPFIFKASYDKANRSSIDSFRGPGLIKGLQSLETIKQQLNVPVLSDVHTEEEIEPASQVLDVLQIPAFLCRQTNMIIKAAKTGCSVNVKKGQFMAPWDMKNVVDKLSHSGCKKILLTERGFTFGYNNLVVDMRSLVLMRNLGYPIIFDATHSLQLPGGKGNKSGGQKELIPDLVRGAVAVGCDAIFMEVHPNPDKAKSDGPNMLKLSQLPELLKQIKTLDLAVKN